MAGWSSCSPGSGADRVDEYEIEIRQLRRTLARLRAEKAREELIEEYEAELRILVALYQAATETLARGENDPDLPLALEAIGFGEWTLSNVYSFVYEAAMDAEPDGRDLANVITHTDYPASLLMVLSEP
jgi:L-fucose isomerase-like protein